MTNELREALRGFDYTRIPEKRRPAEGNHWICQHCGKRAADQYGMIGPRSTLWYESCMLNAVEIGHDAPTIG